MTHIDNKADRAAYIERMDAQLKEWRAEYDKLQAKAEKASADAKAHWQQQQADLKARMDETRERLDGLRASGDKAWEEMKAGFETSWNAMGDAWKRATSHF